MPDQYSSIQYISMSTRYDVTCAVRTTGEVDCWGRNASSDAPAGPHREVSVGGSHTCALNARGEISCWGGLADQTDVPPGIYQAVSATNSSNSGQRGGFTCAIRDSGELVCWPLEEIPPEIR